MNDTLKSHILSVLYKLETSETDPDEDPSKLTTRNMNFYLVLKMYVSQIYFSINSVQENKSTPRHATHIPEYEQAIINEAVNNGQLNCLQKNSLVDFHNPLKKNRPTEKKTQVDEELACIVKCENEYETFSQRIDLKINFLEEKIKQTKLENKIKNKNAFIFCGKKINCVFL